jgi:hypothetical protein
MTPLGTRDDATLQRLHEVVDRVGEQRRKGMILNSEACLRVATVATELFVDAMAAEEAARDLTDKALRAFVGEPNGFCETCENEGLLYDPRCKLDTAWGRCTVLCPDCNDVGDTPPCGHTEGRR